MDCLARLGRCCFGFFGPFSFTSNRFSAMNADARTAHAFPIRAHGGFYAASLGNPASGSVRRP